jgi:hypothetical protein
MDTVTINGTVVQQMLQSALAFSAERAELQTTGQARSKISGGDCTVCEYLRYGLSKEIGQYLGNIDDSVQTVYAYEPEYATGVLHLDSAGPGIDPGINLIVAVDRKNHALNSIVASLEDAVKAGVRDILCSKANGSCFALDVKVVDAEELASRRGYAALVDSVYLAPMRLWDRVDLV